MWNISACEKSYRTKVKSAVLYPFILFLNCDYVLRRKIHLCKTCPVKWTLCLAARLKIAWQIVYTV